MRCSDFTNCAECENPKPKGTGSNARTSTTTGRWHLWTNGKGKGNSLPHLFNIQPAGFTSIPRARTFNAHTLAFQMHLNMGSAHGNNRDRCSAAPRQLAASCRESLPPVDGNLRQVAARIASEAVARQLAATCGNLPRKPPAATCRKLPRVAT